jgi:hypothetical protein
MEEPSYYKELMKELPKPPKKQFPNPDTQFKAGAKQVEIARRAGSTPTPAVRSIGQKIRHMRQKGLSDESAQQLYDIMMSGDLSSLDTLTIIKSMQNKCKTLQETALLSKLLLDWHKLRHGNKLSIDSTSTTVDKKIYEFRILHVGILEGGVHGNDSDRVEAKPEAVISLPVSQG